MVKRGLQLLCVGIALLVGSASAQTMVLIHGFQANGMEWRFNGVTPVLQQYGWTDGGHYSVDRGHIQNPAEPVGHPVDIFYTIMLPSRAPIAVQRDWLNRHLQLIYARRQEPLILVGHSAGGVVARDWLVEQPHVPVHTLVTIASPHLGTPLADLSSQVANTPLAEMASDMGFAAWTETPRQLYEDLKTEAPNTFLHWLNHKPHPAIRYISIVRAAAPKRPDNADFIVPPYSQDMNNVFVLRNHTEVITVTGSHLLEIADGYALANALPLH